MHIIYLLEGPSPNNTSKVMELPFAFIPNDKFRLTPIMLDYKDPPFPQTMLKKKDS